ncbi:MAG: flagellar protein FliL [Bdellovibrionaceae bacterium]|jgi:flagellar protein FliL|nr:flagellar protein FliL [Pseudobdellovibrionaceae bacterium]
MSDEQAPVEKSSGGSGKMLGIIFAVVNLVAMGAGGFLAFKGTLGIEKKVVREGELNKELEEFRKTLQGEPVMFSMKTFNANLYGIPRRMVRIDVSLEMLDAEGFEEIINVEPEVRDSIISILNAKRFYDVESVQGKLHLKSEIIAKVNSYLDRGVVKNVFYTDFVVQ